MRKCTLVIVISVILTTPGSSLDTRNNQALTGSSSFGFGDFALFSCTIFNKVHNQLQFNQNNN